MIHSVKKKSQINVALFRGINVGGNNKVEMKKLKTSFETLGFTDVQTYINSGNVVFKSEVKALSVLATMIEKEVEKDFNLVLRILVKDLASIETIHQTIPTTWVKDKTMRTDVMFLWEEFDNPKVVAQFNLNVVDNIKYTPGALIWNILGQDYTHSAMPKMIGTPLYKNMTIRNVNTFRKIHEMMKGIEDRK